MKFADLLPVILGTGFTFFMTMAGAAMVFLLGRHLNQQLLKCFMGFAAGVMIAASVWSLLLPAIEEAAAQGRSGVVPAGGGFFLGSLFFLAVDFFLQKLQTQKLKAMDTHRTFFAGKFSVQRTFVKKLFSKKFSDEERSGKNFADKNFADKNLVGKNLTGKNLAGKDFAGKNLANNRISKKLTMLYLAVTLHNIPEGMAVGMAFVMAAQNEGDSGVTMLSAIALALGIGIQNFPEGAAITLPLRQENLGRKKAFLHGTLSGIVEPIAGVLTVLAAGTMKPILPWLLSFAAGAMIYVVVEELIPEAHVENGAKIGTIGALFGFLTMMILDVALG